MVYGNSVSWLSELIVVVFHSLKGLEDEMPEAYYQLSPSSSVHA